MISVLYVCHNQIKARELHEAMVNYFVGPKTVYESPLTIECEGLVVVVISPPRLDKLKDCFFNYIGFDEEGVFTGSDISQILELAKVTDIQTFNIDEYKEATRHGKQ